MFFGDSIFWRRLRALEKAGGAGVISKHAENLVTNIREDFLGIATIGEGLMVIVPVKENNCQSGWM